MYCTDTGHLGSIRLKSQFSITRLHTVSLSLTEHHCLQSPRWLRFYGLSSPWQHALLWVSSWKVGELKVVDQSLHWSNNVRKQSPFRLVVSWGSCSEIGLFKGMELCKTNENRDIIYMYELLQQTLTKDKSICWPATLCMWQNSWWWCSREVDVYLCNSVYQIK